MGSRAEGQGFKQGSGVQSRLVSRNSSSRHQSRAGHPGWRRCSSLTHSRFARSSRLAIRARRAPGTYDADHFRDARLLRGSRACASPAGRSRAAAGRWHRPSARARAPEWRARRCRSHTPRTTAARDPGSATIMATACSRLRDRAVPTSGWRWRRADRVVTSESSGGMSSSRSCGLQDGSRNSSALSCTTGSRTAARRRRCACRDRDRAASAGGRYVRLPCPSTPGGPGDRLARLVERRAQRAEHLVRRGSGPMISAASTDSTSLRRRRARDVAGPAC